MEIVRVTNPSGQAEVEYRNAQTAQAIADIEYIAMMTGVDIFEGEEGGTDKTMVGAEAFNEQDV